MSPRRHGQRIGRDKRAMGALFSPEEEMPDLPRSTVGIVHCLCPNCFQVAAWSGKDFEALCTRCEGYGCTNSTAHCI